MTNAEKIGMARYYKDFGHHAYFGAMLSSNGNHKKYLRKHHLGKFAKGRKK